RRSNSRREIDATAQKEIARRFGSLQDEDDEPLRAPRRDYEMRWAFRLIFCGAPPRQLTKSRGAHMRTAGDPASGTCSVESREQCSKATRATSHATTTTATWTTWRSCDRWGSRRIGSAFLGRGCSPKGSERRIRRVCRFTIA